MTECEVHCILPFSRGFISNGCLLDLELVVGLSR